jgi:sodium-independent sulfate anion transporter 11
VIDFISVPVTAGFTSAAAITIASGQIGGLFGLQMNKKSGVDGVTGTWIDIIDNFDSIRLSDTILGITCTLILLAMKV